MYYKRLLKAKAKNIFAKISIFVVIFTTVCAFSINSVHAMVDLSFPVDIIWNDSDKATRPAAVTLHVRHVGSTTNLATVTLTDADEDPTNENRWSTLITGITYDPSYAYEVVQDGVDDYTITSSSDIDVTTQMSILNYQKEEYNSSAHVVKEYTGNFVLVGKKNYVLWANDCSTSADFQNIYAEITGKFGSAYTVNTCESESPYASDEVNISYDSATNKISVESNQGGNFTAFYGTIDTVPSGDLITLTNTYHPTYDVEYQFTGSAMPPNASSLLPATVSYEEGDTITVADALTAEGYRFLGWKRNDSPISGTFAMPAEDVTITGSWERFNGYFSPTISASIPSQPDYYRVDDTVYFDITVTNTANFPITNVHVSELMPNAAFVEGTGYTLASNQEAIVGSIAANSSIVLHAQYTVIQDLSQTLTNSFEITDASADNYYFFDDSQTYIANASFYVRGWQDDPVPSGINSSSTTFYSFLMLIGAIGLGTIVVMKDYRK